MRLKKSLDYLKKEKDKLSESYEKESFNLETKLSQESDQLLEKEKFHYKIILNEEQDFLKKQKEWELKKKNIQTHQEAELIGFKNKSLKELTKEIYQEMTSSPKELKPYLEYGEFVEILRIDENLNKSLKELKGSIK
jgi:hypothetical protein